MGMLSEQLKTFTEAYGNYYAAVYNGIYAKTRDIDISNDLTQEVFTRFYEKMNEIKNPRAWIAGAMRMVLFEFYRKNRKKYDEVDIDELLDDSSMSYVNGFRDTRIIIQQALDNTEHYQDEKDRLIFELVAINNYTYIEVSKRLGLSERQVAYKYRCVADRIVDHLRKKGIKSLEEML